MMQGKEMGVGSTNCCTHDNLQKLGSISTVRYDIMHTSTVATAEANRNPYL